MVGRFEGTAAAASELTPSVGRHSEWTQTNLDHNQKPSGSSEEGKPVPVDPLSGMDQFAQTLDQVRQARADGNRE